MACYFPVARFPLVCLFAALGAGCMQSPQAAVRSDAAVQTAQVSCQSGGDAQWRAMEQALRAQGLAVSVQCAGASSQGALQLVVLDAVRASEVLRGPLADGERVELGLSANASPDVQFNRAWLERALAHHQRQMAAGGHAAPGPLPVDFAAR